MNSNAQHLRRNIVVIGSSAGGVEALQEFFSRLPANTGASFFVVQHISPHYTSNLDRILQRVTSMRVVFAQDNDAIEPNTVYIASPDRHLLFEEEKIRVTRSPKECRARPAVNVLFRSAALNFGPRVIGVVLSGLLDDGTAGLWQIKDREGLALVQDPANALHSSMPESAIEHVAIDLVGDIEALVGDIVHKTADQLPLPGVGEPSTALQIENTIAMEGNGMQAGIMELGPVSKYTCPECHGVLVQIKERSILRFRCHTGHAYSVQTLVASVDDAIDKGLWTTIRAIEERIFLLRQRSELALAEGNSDAAARYKAQADDSEKKYQPLRELVLDAEFFSDN